MELKPVRKIDSFNVVLFIALVPEETDLNGDSISEAEITKTAYEFMQNLQEKKVNVTHKDGTDISGAIFVESYIVLTDTEYEGSVIPKGSWIVGIQLDDENYQKVLDGDFIWISIEWRGKYE